MSISIEPSDQSLDVSGTRSPYPFFAAKRATEPVWHGSIMDYGIVPPEMIPDDEYTLFTYPLVSQAFREHSKFSSSGYDSSMGLIIGPSMLGMTGQKHRDHRNLVSKAFRAKSLARWEPEFIVPICAELIDHVKADGSADLRMSQVPWNFGGGPVSIRLRSPRHCARRVRQVRRSGARELSGASVGAGDRSHGGTACRPRPSRRHTSAAPSARPASV